MTSTRLSSGFRLLVALLVVASTVPVGAVSAQTDSTYTHQYTGGPADVVIDQSNITGDFTVTISTTEVTGREGQKTLLVQKRLGSGTEQDIVYMNRGAYDNLTVEVDVHDSGEPTFETGRISDPAIPYIIGSTGGDADLQCSDSEKIASMTNPLVTNTDCTPPPYNGVNTTGLDTSQVKTDIYQSAQNQDASAEIYQTTLDNYLKDTETQARIIGKNAYIRSLNNGSSKAAAETAAKEAVADYYATKQVNLAKQWSAQLANYQYLNRVAANESGLSGTTLTVDSNSNVVSTGFLSVEIASTDAYDGQPSYLGMQQGSVSLVNGSSTAVTEVGLEMYFNYESGGSDRDTEWFDPTEGSRQLKSDPSGSSAVMYTPSGLGVEAPNSNYNRLQVVRFDEYAAKWSAIQSQNSRVQNDMDTLVNNTYDAYQSGEINNSDLVDPYVLANEFSAGDEFQGWTAAQLTMIGTNSPDAMDSVGHFNISAESGNYTGILMSQNNPASGQFETNTTYDPSNIAGTQYVVTEDQIHELTTNFTISSIETTTGESRQNVTIEKTTYDTANINLTQLKAEYEELAEWRAEVEAREQTMRSGSGGFVIGNNTSLGLLVAVAGGVLLLANRRDGGRY